MTNHPHKEIPDPVEDQSKSFIIERHEDGSECRKCTNCACMNNKLAKIGLENTEIKHGELDIETASEID